MMELMSALDADGDGEVSMKELRNGLERYGEEQKEERWRVLRALRSGGAGGSGMCAAIDDGGGCLGGAGGDAEIGRKPEIETEGAEGGLEELPWEVEGEDMIYDLDGELVDRSPPSKRVAPPCRWR